MMRKTFDVHVAATIPLDPPLTIMRDLPITRAANETVFRARQAVADVLEGRDRRMLVVVGPCSIHDEAAALDYAGRLKTMADRLDDRLLIVMRVYFEKPRTIIGWKGLINDPNLDGTFDMATGLRKARKLLLQINEMGLPAATEMLDPITPQYIADLIAWASIGARTTESQTHRQMSSGLSMPMGYKNSTDGNLQTAIDAMQSARQPHHFLGMDRRGRTCIVKTTGNPLGHLILRGGRSGPNYDPIHVQEAIEAMERVGLPPPIMVDCNHANSGKRPQNQRIVWNSVIDQRRAGTRALIGLMLESNLEEGSQSLPEGGGQLRYGVSITDPCTGWADTEAMLLQARHALAEEQG